jgi:hypothetical protein
MVDRTQETAGEGGLVPGNGGGGQNESILRVDRDAVPGLRGAFADALTRVDRQLDFVEKELRVTPWAQDPVSLGASTTFNDRSLDADADAAVDQLRSYRDQLDAAIQNLDVTAEQYRKIDEENVTGTASQG